jgi:hypothetical protein
MAADVREPRYVHSLWSSKFKMRASKHQNLITVFEFRILKFNSKNHVDAYWSYSSYLNLAFLAKGQAIRKAKGGGSCGCILEL